MSKLILALFLSWSVRTAKLDDCKNDYELAGGINTKYGKIESEFERENDMFYRGLKIRTVESSVKQPKEEILTLLDGVSAEINISEGSNTHEQYLYKNMLDLLGIAKIRITNKWQHWQDHNILIGAELDFSNKITTCRLQYDTNTYDKIFRAELSTMITHNKFYYKPIFKYNGYNYKRNDFQIKNEVGIKF